MDFYSPTIWKGQITVTPLRQNDEGLWVPAGEGDTFPNLVVDSGLDLIASSLENGVNVDTQINYFALGTDNTTEAPGDTSLGAEAFRKLVTAYTTGVTTGQIITTGYVAPSEANGFQIEEIGWFAGATATTDSGTLMARVVYQRQKVASEALQIDRTDTFS